MGPPMGLQQRRRPDPVILMHRPGEEVRLVTKENYLPEIGSFGDPAKGWYWRGTHPPDLPKMQRTIRRLANARCAARECRSSTLRGCRCRNTNPSRPATRSLR